MSATLRTLCDPEREGYGQTGGCGYVCEEGGKKVCGGVWENEKKQGNGREKGSETERVRKAGGRKGKPREMEQERGG